MAADGANGGCKLLYGCQQSGQIGGMLAMACLVAIVLERAPLGRVGSEQATERLLQACSTSRPPLYLCPLLEQRPPPLVSVSLRPARHPPHSRVSQPARANALPPPLSASRPMNKLHPNL